MNIRRVASSAVLPATLILLAGCSSPTAGHGTLAGPPTDAAGLVALMQRGSASITSAHFALDVTSGAQNVQAQGEETLSGGKVLTLDMSENISQVGTVRLRVVGEQTFVALPEVLNHSNKPWAVISASSSDPVIKSLSASIDSARNAASLNTSATFVTAAKSVTLDGPAEVDGTAASHYSLVVDVSKLPPAYPGREQLITAGLDKLPVELWIDTPGRPVQVSEHFSIHGQSVSTKIVMSKFNVAVHITAPPADQVSTD